MKSQLLLTVLVGGFSLVWCGCGSGKSGPLSPKVDLSKKRVPFTVKEEDLNFPEGFPKEIKLLKPTVIYEQDVLPDMITWDTQVSVAEARDHYLSEFEKLGYQTNVIKPKGEPGENYIIQATGSNNEKCFCVGLGCASKREQVKCYIYAEEIKVSPDSPNKASKDAEK